MKTIYCVRHAKSSWADLTITDQERPLNNRGRRDAPIMAMKLVERIKEVDIALVSPARRAQETAEVILDKLKSHEIQTVDKIYHADVQTLIDVIMEIDDRHNTAIMFGHNPGFTFLYNSFSANLLDNLPTCGIYRIDIDASSWQDIDSTCAKSSGLLYPKMFL